MKLIIPMAGRGTRLRPQSSVTPKPLLNVKGKSIVERIVEGFRGRLPRPIAECVFVLGPSFGQEVRDALASMCQRQSIAAHFVVQEKALGTAHAVSVAGEHLCGEGVVVYADTVFEMGPSVALAGCDVLVWVKEVDDPSRFGVAVREGDRVVALVEKPQELISREALIGIYYVRELRLLQEAIDHLFEADRHGPGGEYYLTDAFDVMLKSGGVFKTATVRNWLDCGTLEALMDTTRHLLRVEDHTPHPEACENSILVEPVYLGAGARVINSVIGPFVSVEKDARITGSVIRDSIIFSGARVHGIVLKDSFIGARAQVGAKPAVLNVGDHSILR